MPAAPLAAAGRFGAQPRAERSKRTSLAKRSCSSSRSVSFHATRKPGLASYSAASVATASAAHATLLSSRVARGTSTPTRCTPTSARETMRDATSSSVPTAFIFSERMLPTVHASMSHECVAARDRGPSSRTLRMASIQMRRKTSFKGLRATRLAAAAPSPPSSESLADLRAKHGSTSASLLYPSMAPNCCSAAFAPSPTTIARSIVKASAFVRGCVPRSLIKTKSSS